MSTTWSLPAYLDALVANLKARPGLEGVVIWSAPIDKDLIDLEMVAFIDVITDENSAALGDNRREEIYVIEGVVEVHIAGTGDATAKEARDRVAEIFAEIEAEIRANVTQGLSPQVVRFSEITTINLRQRIRDDYRRCVLEFDVTVHHRK